MPVRFRRGSARNDKALTAGGGRAAADVHGREAQHDGERNFPLRPALTHGDHADRMTNPGLAGKFKKSIRPIAPGFCFLR